jgi:tetratricopeptide (TPR) repeat protein
MSEPSSPFPPAFTALLQRGQAMENEGRFDAALDAYDQALAFLRLNAPAAAPDTLNALGAVWLYRGDTLQRVGTAPSLKDAVTAYDEAIACFEKLPLDPDPRLRQQLGAAWLNRGHTQIVAENFPAAVESFTAAVRVLAPLPIAQDPHFRLNLAGAHTNVAHALLSAREGGQLDEPDSLLRAAAAARSALQTIAEAERSHEVFAGLSLRARRALVVALGSQLAPAQQRGEPLQPLVAEATDAVDEGLALARALEEHNLPQHRPLAQRLFRMGAQLYGGHQPQFLGEFVLEVLSCPAFASDPEFRRVADSAVNQCLAALRNVAAPGPAEQARLADIVAALGQTQAQLATLPPAGPGTVSSA